MSIGIQRLTKPMTTDASIKLILASVLTVVSILISFIIAVNGIKIGAAILLVIFGASILAVIYTNYRYGFLLLVIYGFFLFQLSRVLPFDFPVGIVMDLMILILFVSVTIDQAQSDKPWYEVFKNPVGYAILIYEGYAILEFVNPYSTSLMGRLVHIRAIIGTPLLYFVVMKVFSDLRQVKLFTKFWLGLALLAAIYGLYQEYVGLQDWEWQWIHSQPGRYEIMHLWGNKVRKWSFLSDVAAFGMFMAFSGVVCTILMLGPFKISVKILLGIAAVAMFLSMSYSGTRTAMVMVPVGIYFYILCTINNVKTLTFSILAATIFIILIFGPFYGGTLSRLRTAFNPQEDASMSVRDFKRNKLQPYVQSHPIGGGLNTAGHTGAEYSPSHELAGDWDPDSGYLRLALERGWIGLIINLGLNATVLFVGISNFYRARNPTIKILLMAYSSAFFSMTIAQYVQDAVGQKPVSLIIVSTYALVVKLGEFDKEISPDAIR